MPPASTTPARQRQSASKPPSTPTESEPPKRASLLPTSKTPPQSDPLKRPVLLYGDYKIGKSTLASELHEKALFLATEPGLNSMEVFRVDIKTWGDFLNVIADLREKPEQHPIVVIDTVDELARLCQEHVLSHLAGGPVGSAYLHASDFEYGKGWDAIRDEFKLRVAALCRIGPGVLFISHAKEEMVETASGVGYKAMSPDVGQKGMRKWLLGYVDFIFYATMVRVNGDDGPVDKRVLYTQPTHRIQAGGRFARQNTDKIPQRVSLDAGAMRKVLEMIA